MTLLQGNTVPPPGSPLGSAAAAHPPAPGLRSGAAAAPQRNQRHRPWGLVSLAGLLVVGSGLAVAVWGLNAGQKESVLSVRDTIAKGQVIERDDLVSRAVAGLDDAIAATDVATVVGQTASVDLVPGQVLSLAMLTSDPLPAAGQATVGLSLEPSRVPGAGLVAGDTVDVIAVPSNGQGKDVELDSPMTLARDAQVYAVGGESTAGGLVLVTLVVPAQDAAQISAYSTQNRVAVVEKAPAGRP